MSFSRSHLLQLFAKLAKLWKQNSLDALFDARFQQRLRLGLPILRRHREAHLPATIVQGRHDVICPPITASRLAAKWGRKAKLEIIDAAGHSTFESGIAHALLAALEEI